MLVHCSPSRRAKVSTGTDRCQIQSQAEHWAISISCFHRWSHPILTLNFKDIIEDASVWCRTVLVITAKQNRSDMMSVLSGEQSRLKSQQDLLSSRCILHWPHHQNRELDPALGSFLPGSPCFCPHVAVPDLFSPRSALQTLSFTKKGWIPTLAEGCTAGWCLKEVEMTNDKMSQRTATCISPRSRGPMLRTTDLPSSPTAKTATRSSCFPTAKSPPVSCLWDRGT